MSKFYEAQRNYDAMLPPEDDDRPEPKEYQSAAQHLVNWLYEKGHQLIDLDNNTLLESNADALSLIENVDEARLEATDDRRTRFLVSTAIDLDPDEQVIDYTVTALSEEWAEAYESEKDAVDVANELALHPDDFDLSQGGT